SHKERGAIDMARGFRRFLVGAAVLEQPIRAELFGPGRLGELAIELARGDRETHGFTDLRCLRSRLAENARALVDAHTVIADAARRQQTITPAAEWILDNFHVIENHLAAGKQDLAQQHRLFLPTSRIASAPSQPRVLRLAESFVAHTDSRFDPDLLH